MDRVNFADFFSSPKHANHRKRPRQTGMGAAGGLGWRLVFELGGDDATGSGKLFAVSLVAAFLFAIDPNSFGILALPDVWHQLGVVCLAG